jgi:hypothetical protein
MEMKDFLDQEFLHDFFLSAFSPRTTIPKETHSHPKQTLEVLQFFDGSIVRFSFVKERSGVGHVWSLSQ